LPEALLNYLARLGHNYAETALLDQTALAGAFDLAHIGHSPAHFDHQQLEHWQGEAVRHADSDRLWQWLAESESALSTQVPAAQRAEFVATVRGNLTRPRESLHWARVLNGEAEPDQDAMAVLRQTDAGFFRHALDCLPGANGAFSDYARAVATASGRKGKALYMPLRAALTGRLHGPEMERLWKLLPAASVERQLRRAAELAVN
ncbi:MAG TPA: glutamate--tRNA ligase, partial [Gammaproteobacteria bacterium]|nr:glutamate--tRNA ligase [Gammaproteobacteria bacterium]